MRVMYTAWKEVNHLKGEYGDSVFDTKGLFVYIIKKYRYSILDSNPCDYLYSVMYIGKTTTTINNRIKQHIKENSPIGRAISKEENDENGGVHWCIDAVQVDKNLDFAERYYIEIHNPVYNVMLNGRIELDVAEIHDTAEN